MVMCCRDQTDRIPAIRIRQTGSTPCGRGERSAEAAPRLQNPPGLILQIYARNGFVAISAPSNETSPRWQSFDARIDHYSYRVNDAPADVPLLRRARLRDGRLLRVRGLAGPLATGAPLGPVAVRVISGSLASCALFDAATIRRDTESSFFATDARAEALSDCTDETLTAAVGLTCGASPSCGGVCPGDGECGQDISTGECRCVFPTDACRSTAPICNGACGPGEECVPVVGYATDDCVCTPLGVTPCGAHGQHPICDVSCPGGRECVPYRGKFNASCGCSDLPCEQGGLHCPAGFQCDVYLSRTCAPIFCQGTDPFPSCGSSCPGDWECRPLRAFDGAVDFCACSPPGGECEPHGGGLGCPPNQVCTVDRSLEVRTCEPLRARVLEQDGTVRALPGGREPGRYPRRPSKVSGEVKSWTR